MSTAATVMLASAHPSLVLPQHFGRRRPTPCRPSPLPSAMTPLLRPSAPDPAPCHIPTTSAYIVASFASAPCPATIRVRCHRPIHLRRSDTRLRPSALAPQHLLRLLPPVKRRDKSKGRGRERKGRMKK
ncbi:hypothetical protein GUJ93_ZPchr0014g46809 [Zizania palustris]|uniref:Uncharacterized protein n=1 Tax=Zizania palustris TaxID=103762 RepID=A0A8J5TES2_ZIZPA|nr:hypothetical protein GUJ93_ZPchr0014g46809 [Zizania palustris]